jgi:hypothetical protein
MRRLIGDGSNPWFFGGTRAVTRGGAHAALPRDYTALNKKAPHLRGSVDGANY